jgi:hypothetical protein
MKTIRINEIKNRLEALGTTYYMQGGSVIRNTFDPSIGCSRECQLNYGIRSVNEAAAGAAYHVLQNGETLAARWLYAIEV